MAPAELDTFIVGVGLDKPAVAYGAKEDFGVGGIQLDIDCGEPDVTIVRFCGEDLSFRERPSGDSKERYVKSHTGEGTAFIAEGGFFEVYDNLTRPCSRATITHSDALPSGA